MIPADRSKPLDYEVLTRLFQHHVQEMLTRQRRLSWAKYNELLKLFPLPTPKLTHSWKSRTV